MRKSNENASEPLRRKQLAAVSVNTGLLSFGAAESRVLARNAKNRAARGGGVSRTEVVHFVPSL